MTYSLSKLNYEAIKSLGQIDFNSEHIFDLSGLTFAYPDGIVLLRLILHKLCNENSKKVNVLIPEKSSSEYSVRRYLAHVNFFRGLNVSLSLKDSVYLNSRQIWPGRPKSSPTHTKLIGGTDYELKSKMPGLVLVLVNFLKNNHLIREQKEYIYRNIFDEAFLNQRNHSNPHDENYAYFCAQAQIYKTSKIRLGIGDVGVGIKESLNTIYNFNTDQAALEAAVENRQSRFVNDEERGGGVRYIFDKSRELKFNCLLRSGNAEVIQRKGDQNFRYNITPFIPGTQLILWN